MPRWDVVRQRLAAGRNAQVGQELWQRIEATRAREATVHLPREGARLLPRLGLYATVALAAALTFASRDRPAASEVLTTSITNWGWPLLPEAAFAQGNQVKHLPAIASPDGSRLKPGQWVYSWTPAREDHPRDLPRMADTVTIRRGSFRDEAVWLVTQMVGPASGKGAGRLDSLYLNISNLRPLRHALLPYRSDRFQRWGSMDFEGDSLRWQFRLPGSGIPGRDTVVTALLTVDYAAVWSGFPLLLSGIQFAKSWVGAVPMLQGSIDWSGHDSPVHVYWIDLRVRGRERLTVPAGTFDCWRISESMPGYQDGRSFTELWVDRRSGILVKETPGPLSDSAHGRELAAILP
jgi:hypothetical protein